MSGVGPRLPYVGPCVLCPNAGGAAPLPASLASSALTSSPHLLPQRGKGSLTSDASGAAFGPGRRVCSASRELGLTSRARQGRPEVRARRRQGHSSALRGGHALPQAHRAHPRCGRAKVPLARRRHERDPTLHGSCASARLLAGAQAPAFPHLAGRHLRIQPHGLEAELSLDLRCCEVEEEWGGRWKEKSRRSNFGSKGIVASWYALTMAKKQNLFS